MLTELRCQIGLMRMPPTSMTSANTMSGQYGVLSCAKSWLIADPVAVFAELHQTVAEIW